MYRKCVTETSALHQKQVEQQLLELMLKVPYEEITVTQLCQAAGITRRVFYHLFNSKQDALWAMLDHMILESESWQPELQDPFLRFFCYWKENRKLLDALRANQIPGLLQERLIVTVMQEDFDLRHRLNTSGWEKATDLIVFHLCGAMGLVFRWYYEDFRETPEEMAALLRRILTVPHPDSVPSK